MKEKLKDIAAWTVVIVFCPIWFPIKMCRPHRRRCAAVATIEAHARHQEAQRKDYEEYLRVNSPKPINPRRRAVSRAPTGLKSQSKSDFLRRLPPEIRLQIYEYVLGGQVFHLVQVPRRIAHVQCDRHNDNRTELFDATRKCFPLCRNRFGPASPVYNHHGSTQGEVWKTYGPLILNSLSTANVAILRSCRQIYQEAVDILYRCNIFDADNILTFLLFTQSILPNRLAMVRHLQIRSEFHNFAPTSLWSYYIAPPFCDINHRHDTWRTAWDVISDKMIGLKELDLFVDCSGHSLSDRDQEAWIAPLLNVRGLKKFEMIFRVRGKDVDPTTDKRMRNTMKRIRKWMYRDREDVHGEKKAEAEAREKELKAQDPDAVGPEAITPLSTMSGAA